ncbi:MAG TPA: type II toxin-antitoxin system VapB family antitoxin [Xanthomonadaceae bacterium]|nr:type II toxin-antitoxin system VapB family antitoxin [Xanthomonadaceae bacterium]
MKTTIDIPDQELADAIHYTRARTKREAVVIALSEFNRRRRMAELVKYTGTGDQMMTAEELQALRRES